ncbi:MAG: class I tRNA ligase family protein, partial [Acidobacteriota bacterium]|nr:class I tRNA ligase family protein [Acidobacteriota bacterium]
PRCADFKVENEILEGNRCPIHEIPLTRESEENWFFKLSEFQEPLERLFAAQPDFVMPARAYNEAHAFIAQGLRDISLSRAKLTWGVKVPWDPTHVFYVWFDADLNYYTALGYARPGEDLTDRYWPAQLHLIGKDIVKFHAIYWPAMLLAAGIELPQHVFVHGFLMAQDGRRMSKLFGNVLDPFEATDEFGSDALRFYLMREVQFGQDGNVGFDGVRARYDTELANEYGNLASRTLSMIARYADGAVPDSAIDPQLAPEFDGLQQEVAERMDRFELTHALDLIWQRVRRLNRYVEERKPWELARDPAAAAQLDTVLASLHHGLRAVTVELAPYIPAASATVLAAVDVTPIEPIAPLFPKRDR